LQTENSVDSLSIESLYKDSELGDPI